MDSRKKNILVVDDSLLNHKYLQEVFLNQYHLSFLSSGKEAICYLKDKMPDLILLDIVMPEMDGFQVYQELQKLDSAKDIPVIFMTADKDRNNEIKGLDMGALDFITKPFVPEVVSSRINRVLGVADFKRELMKQVEVKTEEAQKDSLTGLWNRGFMEKQVNHSLHEQNNKGTLFILDMDNFKAINDTYGHLVGDAVLVRFAKTLKKAIRRNDMACRIGGDEFILFFNGALTREKGEEKASEIISYFEKALHETSIIKSDAGVSIGIAVAPLDGNDFLSLYKNADRALYYVKQNGKRGYHYYREENANEYIEEPSISTQVDLGQLIKMIKEDHFSEGAFQVEYDGFQRIYQFVSRCIGRTHQNVQILLFTLFMENGGTANVEDMDASMIQLEKAIRKSLRRGDVGNHYSSSQFIVILMDTSADNGRIVANRVLRNYKNKQSNMSIQLKYDMEELETKAKEE
ncbi:MAG: diguanylate cyclase [Lachnospiraceae bacterium]|nr:diguanylate cyclase [Lachnospiraceae bacterium]